MRRETRTAHLRALLLCSTAILFLMVEPGVARTDNPPQPVGRIVSSGCAEKDLVIKRTHSAMKRQDSQLYEGDEITIAGANCTVEIRVGNATRILSLKDTPYTAPSVKGTFIPRLIFAMGIGKGATGQGHSQGISQGHTRDGDSNEISLPILKLWSSQIEAGTRPLRVAWRGGEGPFQITLWRANAALPLATHDNVVENQATLDETDLKPGTYQIRVKDSANRHQEGNFTVVDSSDLPPLPTELENYQEEDPPKPLLEAGWLATQEGGKFVFEAYQRISPLALMNPEANQLKVRLEKGWRPRLPRN